MAAAQGMTPTISSGVAQGALAALKAGDAATHDRLIAAAAASLPPVDALVLAQFTMARAAAAIQSVPGCVVLTTPESAVAKLRALVEECAGTC